MGAAELMKVDPLENFRVLAEGTKGEGLTYIITNVIKDPRVFVFGEILNVQSVKDVSTSVSFLPPSTQTTKCNCGFDATDE